MEPDPTRIADVEAARAQLGERVRETPVWRWRDEVHLKLELLQYSGSFKVRGALCNMLALDGAALGRGVTTVSAGNHALATAHAARALGTTARVVMFEGADPSRVAGCRALGAEAILAKDVHEAFETAKAIERDEGRTFVHPFEGPRTALGTATLGLEVCRQVEDLDAVVVPIGGGGLCAGVSAAVKALQPRCRVYGVEPEGADSMHRSFAAGEPRSIETVRTIADSLGAPYALPYSFDLCKRFVDELVMVDDAALCRALALLFREMKLAVEPAAAAATAALMGPLQEKLAGKRVALIVCGTNIHPERFRKYLAQGERGSVDVSS